MEQQIIKTLVLPKAMIQAQILVFPNLARLLLFK